MGKISKDDVVSFVIRATLNFLSEFLGTGALVFTGCMGCVLSLGEPGDLTGIALVFGIAIVIGVEIGIHISGGYINPMLTLLGIIFKKVSIPMALVYVVAQLCGSLAGFGLLKVLTPKEPVPVIHPLGLCTTYRNPEVSLVQAVAVEFIISSILVLVVCAQWDPRNTRLETVSLKIGFAVFALIYAAANYTGASMNPARSFAPAVWNNSWDDHWIYWVSPFSAAFFWGLIYYKIFVELDPNNKQMIGTAVLVFLGCMGVCKGLGQEGDHTGVVLSFAFAVFAAVQITCHNSGGHVNPAVTVLSLFFKKLKIPMAAVYVCGQITGGVVGFGFLKAITPAHLLNAKGFQEFGLCSTVPNPNLTVLQAVFTEFFLTSILLLIVCSAWDPRNAYHDSLTIKFGFAVYSLAYAGVAYTGCSMNPARSFGPAIWNQTWKHHWIYWIGPLLAALFCGFLYTTFFCPKIPQISSTSAENTKINKEEIEMGS